jgi:hypothetical protein
MTTVARAHTFARGRQKLHPATKTFLALRIAVNRELEDSGSFEIGRALLFSFVAILTLTLAGLAPASAQVAMPRREITPGLARPLSKATVCSTKWGRDERHVDESTKKKVCEAYGAKHCPGPDWELDHLVSRELAGADDAKNLWPQPIAEARLKDRLENLLHKKVCAGEISLAEAQREIGADWYAAYKKYFGASAAR